mgnify:CR=1 FL=1
MGIIEEFRIKVPFETFREHGARFIKKPDISKKKDNEINSYYISYPEFLEYFKNTTEIKKHNLIIGINFVYGWMPRGLRFHSENFDEVLKILNKAKSGQLPLTKEDLDILKETLDHSLIGVSKLLHFINPEAFAIWDSKVYNYLMGLPEKKKVSHYKTEKAESYLDYLDFCKELTQREEYEEIHNHICKEVEYPMSKFRTAELIMFSTKNDTKSNEK